MSEARLPEMTCPRCVQSRCTELTACGCWCHHPQKKASVSALPEKIEAAIEALLPSSPIAGVPQSDAENRLDRLRAAIREALDEERQRYYAVLKAPCIHCANLPEHAND